jgi:hypothetical protein
MLSWIFKVSASSLKQQSMDWPVAPLWHNILSASQPVNNHSLRSMRVLPSPCVCHQQWCLRSLSFLHFNFFSLEPLDQFSTKLGRNVILVLLNILYDFRFLWKISWLSPVMLSDWMKFHKSSLKKNYILFYEYMFFFCQSEIQNGHHHRTMEYNIFKWFFTETFDSKLKKFVLIWLQRYLPLKVGFLHCNSGLQEEDTKVVIFNGREDVLVLILPLSTIFRLDFGTVFFFFIPFCVTDFTILHLLRCLTLFLTPFNRVHVCLLVV